VRVLLTHPVVAPPWRFEVRDCFNLTDRGPVVIGRIVDGEIHDGDQFRAGTRPVHGTVRGITLVRTKDPEAVGLLLDLELAPGDQRVAVVDDH
jgi:translation elongation factor EF-Tu-like GTPase